MRKLFFWMCLAVVSPMVMAQTCMPLTCQSQMFNCGTGSDGCGGTLNCGSCGSPQTCGGGGSANVCGLTPTCTGLCLQQQTCARGETTISGTVNMPNGTVPVPNALVYIPNAPVQPFTPGVGCGTCTTPPTGSPLVSAVTDANGKFVLHNVPVGSNIPLVVQAGRWRRQLFVPIVSSCNNTVVSTVATRFPRSKAEGDIPLIAIVTGAVDAQECLLRAVGVADSEFSDPSGTGRIRFYAGSGAPGAVISVNTPSDSQLFATSASTNTYDLVMMGCQGTSYAPSSNELDNFAGFVNAGGRVFLDHFSYSWIHPNGNLDALINWNVGQSFSGADPQNATVNTAFTKGATLSNWLSYIGATSTPGQIVISAINHDYDGVIAPATNWLSSVSPAVPLQFGFNTPVGTTASQQCGRVAFLDTHIYPAASTGVKFPGECSPGSMTAEQLLAAYSLFDTTNCVQSDAPASSVGIYSGDRQTAMPGATYASLLQAQVVASDGSNLMGIPVTFSVTAGPNGASGSFSATSPGSSTDYNGVVTATPLGVDPASPLGRFTVTATTAAGLTAAFTMYVGDVIFADGFE